MYLVGNKVVNYEQRLTHYSRTCLKKQKAKGMERLSSSESIHPGLKGGRRLFQRGER